jgi:pimeloyl-ACP methyl ester carboxylesterase
MVFLPAIEQLARLALRTRGVGSRHLETPVGRVHSYVGRGGGALPPVALLHGIGSAAGPFGPVITRLQPHVRSVIAPELPGHGFSAAPRGRMTPDALDEVTRGVLDRLIDEPVVLCGNSLGGALALRYARERPEKVRALVLLSPAGARMSEDELDDVRRAFHMPDTAAARSFLARLYHRTPFFAPLLAGEIRARMQRTVVRDLLATARVEHAATPEELAALPMPVLLVWGRSERLLPASGLAYFRQHLPTSARVDEPQEVGHCAHMDAPALVARRILEVARALGEGGPIL